LSREAKRLALGSKAIRSKRRSIASSSSTTDLSNGLNVAMMKMFRGMHAGHPHLCQWPVDIPCQSEPLRHRSVCRHVALGAETFSAQSGLASCHARDANKKDWSLVAFAEFENPVIPDNSPTTHSRKSHVPVSNFISE